MKGLSLIIQREFTQRVCRKSFIITTLVMPLLMVGLMAMPALVMMWQTPEERTVAVVDHSGLIGPSLEGNESLTLRPVDPASDISALDSIEDIWGILTIDSAILTNPSAVTLRTHEAAPMEVVSHLTRGIKDNIEHRRLQQMGINNLDSLLAVAEADVRITTQRIDTDEEEATDASVAYTVSIVMSVILYMMILMYGQQVMMSIIEEKSSRVLEVMVSSVRPAALMMGKILGVGLVAAIQLLIWAVLLAAAAQWLMPWLLAGGGADFSATLGALASGGYILGLAGWLLLFMIGGYLFYSAMFAAVGSSVDDAQDAGQLQQIVMIPIIVGIMMSMVVGAEPNTPMALWLSLIPFTSPMVMMTRIPYDIPLWQTLVSLGILYASFLAMVWIAAKVYRVGIFMHGKKPSLRDLWRWTRQS